MGECMSKSRKSTIEAQGAASTALSHKEKGYYFSLMQQYGSPPVQGDYRKF